jgi:hypothetical protein
VKDSRITNIALYEIGIIWRDQWLRVIRMALSPGWVHVCARVGGESGRRLIIRAACMYTGATSKKNYNISPVKPENVPDRQTWHAEAPAAKG